MLGNIAIGLSVLAPAGMLLELSDDLGVAVHDAGLLVTYGAFVLCISSPLGAWLTTRLDRRSLLAATIGVLVIGEFATAFAPNYGTVLVLRLLMLVAAAVYTPQAAATVALIVPDKERAGAMSFVFLGWSLAIAAGLPFITFMTTQFGWRIAFGALGCVSLAIAALLLLALPRGLQGRPLSLASFGTIARTAPITLILLITLLTTSGQFSVAVYLAPLLEKLTGEGPATAGLLFGLLGSMGLIGNIAATRIVERQGVQRSFALFAGLVAAGLTLWALGARPPCRDDTRCDFSRSRLCRRQFDAAGTPGGSGARSCQRLDRAQYVAALCRAGGRLRHRRLPVCARPLSCCWICGRVPRDRRARGLGVDLAETHNRDEVRYGAHPVFIR